MRLAPTDPLLLALTVGCAALVGVLVHEAGSPPFVSGTTPPRLAASADDIVDLPTWRMPPAKSFAATVERPLFVRSRRPIAVAAPAAEGSAAPTDAGSLELVLGAVILGPSGGTALLEQAGHEVHFLSEGAEVDGWVLTEISREAVLFTAGERTRRIVLKDLPEAGNSPETPRPRAGAARETQASEPPAAQNWTEEARRITPDGREIEVMPGFEEGADDEGQVVSAPVARIEQSNQ